MPPDVFYYGQVYLTTKVFGCKAMVRDTPNHRNQLEHHSKALLFLGMCDSENGYLFYNPGTGRITQSRDAIFNETSTLDESISHEYQIEFVKRKTRLCARGFTQVPGIDFKDTYSPVVLEESDRILLTLACIENMDVIQLDVETAFLNAPLKEEVIIKPGVVIFDINVS